MITKAPRAQICAGLLCIFGMVLCGISTPLFAQLNTPESEKTLLQSQLKEVQEQISSYQQNIEEAQQAQKSLKNEIVILDAAAQKQKLQLKEIELSLREVEVDLSEKQKEITSLESRLKEKRVLLQLSVRQLQEYDSVNWVSVLFSGESLSDFFSQVRYVKSIQADINDFIANIDNLRGSLEVEREKLEDEKADITRLKSLSGLQKSSLEQKQKEKTTLLVKTKGEEKLYTASIKKSQKDIAMIRQQIFSLESVGVSMSFEEAIKKAQFAGEKTGIRPAFLLAIFQVESRLGTYVGGGSWRKDMKSAERPLFLKITTALGLDPDSMPVSKKPWYGWGGAMGPAQFIPSTWLSYADQVAALTGHNPPSPWNIEDAFIASGLKLVSNGAGGHTYQGERTAAAKYIAGGNYKKSVGQAYANNVMDWAEHYQGQIDILSGVSVKPEPTS
ncbi:MAG: lytic murein transglycosylase [Patescibacteria group bacterium]